MFLMRNRFSTSVSKSRGRYRHGIARFLCLLLLPLWLQAALASADLAEINQLSRSGASELALAMLDEGQPDPAAQPNEWMRWERLRVRILEANQDWPVLAERLSVLPGGLPREFVDWAMLRRAIALVQSGEYPASRQLLRELLWREHPRPSATQVAEYRQWVMQGYLLEGRTDDSLAAVQRYQQDYGERDQDALILRARVLLAAGKAGEAHALLRNAPKQTETEILALLAALRSGEPPKALLTRLQSLDERVGQQDETLQHLLIGSIAEAALEAGNSAVLVTTLQRYLALPEARQAADGLFFFNGDDLWQAWLDFAGQIGNREQLLIGDDATWQRAADKTEARYPVRRHSLYAMLALRGATAQSRSQAHQRLAELLLEQEPGQRLLLRLYLDAPALLPRDRLPEVIAYSLVDQAIRNGDLRLASELMQQLAEPPGGTARFAWQMRRAKVFILATDFAAFDALISDIMQQIGELSAEQRDQLVHLLFDLQNVGEHELAYTLLSEVYQRVPIQALRRELLFWMADSREAQLRHVEAAKLYLQSATLGDVNNMDPWAQTARYQAANSLSRAGLLRDARYIYHQLLKVTDNPERRAVLLRELEQVQMRMAAEGR